MVTIKKKKSDSFVQGLIQELSRFIIELEGQINEADSVAALREIKRDLETSPLGSAQFGATLEKLVDAFEGGLELNSYMHVKARPHDQWDEAEALYLASTSVFNLTQRIMRSVSAGQPS